jgi:polyphosphate kinase
VSPAEQRTRFAIRHLLAKFDYDGKDHEVVGEPDPLIVGRVNLSD